MIINFKESYVWILFLNVLSRILAAQIISTCRYPPCRYDVYRDNEDDGNVIVNDASTHAISWNWEVRGGQWNVTYLHTYPGGWYEGLATFINCSNILRDREQPYVSWGSSKSWGSNAKLIYANPWNITYNGDVFGFVPNRNGKYIFRIYSRNKQHNPFKSEQLVLLPASCSLVASDKLEIKMWWAERKKQRNCPESVINWTWSTNNGRWHVVYKWAENSEKVTCSVFYNQNKKNEVNIINWEIDVPQNLVIYKTNPVRIRGESAWSLDLGPSEMWGFSPTTQDKWIIQHFSRNLVFQPFTWIDK